MAMTEDTRKPKPLPDRQDIDNAPFWAGTEKDELLVKRCDDCTNHHWPPRLGCPYCGSGKLGWVRVAPTGKLYSWTVVHRSQTPGFETETPYAVLLVALDDAKGVRMVGNLVNGALDGLRAGLALEAVFTPSPYGAVKLVNWRPAAAACG
jgi:uncharacterized OB-fold protein